MFAFRSVPDLIHCPICDADAEKPIHEYVQGMQPINSDDIPDGTTAILPEKIHEHQTRMLVDCGSCGLFEITRHCAVNLQNDPFSKEKLAKGMAKRPNKADRVSISTDSLYIYFDTTG